jgi:asparagine synthase (glutamine-hydrolysing)
MQRQGFKAAAGHDWKGAALSIWTHPAQLDVENSDVRTPSGVACCVGPLWYRRLFGSAALSLLLDDFATTGQVDEAELRGNFALYLHTQSHCALMNDVLGFVRVYVSLDRCFYSTSWLATCAYAGTVELDEAAAAEYVLLGASHSDRTVAQGITTLPLAHAFDLVERRPFARIPANAWGDARIPHSFEAAADEICSHLQTVCQEIAAAFHERVRAALSGGFDSRLIVAGLLASGAKPRLFVYGSSDSEDVRIARMVADSARLPLDAIDKTVLNRETSVPDLDRLVHNALFFDGLPTDGIHDPGADQQTRMAQNAEGWIALNGGGGEIFRNFFHLPDRRLRILDVMRAFYRDFDPGVFRHRDGLSAYEGRMASSIGRSLGIEDATARQRLTREQVELVYPLFRCHHWMGVNNSISVRHGYYATPLVDLTLVRLAGRLPMVWKNAGRFESRLIARLHDGLARQPSSYGFRFAEGPSRHARFTEWATRMRPIFARPFISATRRRLHRLAVTPGMIAHCRALLPGEWRMDHVLELERLSDDRAFARALAVEVVWRELVG